MGFYWDSCENFVSHILHIFGDCKHGRVHGAQQKRYENKTSSVHKLPPQLPALSSVVECYETCMCATV